MPIIESVAVVAVSVVAVSTLAAEAETAPLNRRCRLDAKYLENRRRDVYVSDNFQVASANIGARGIATRRKWRLSPVQERTGYAGIAA